MSFLTPCKNCRKEANDHRRCSACNQAHYCSIDCQKAHWKEHKKFCRERAKANKARGNETIQLEWRTWQGLHYAYLHMLVAAIGHATGKRGPEYITRMEFDYVPENPETTKFQIKPAYSVHRVADLGPGMVAMVQQEFTIHSARGISAFMLVKCRALVGPHAPSDELFTVYLKSWYRFLTAEQLAEVQASVRPVGVYVEVINGGRVAMTDKFVTAMNARGSKG